MQYKINGDMMPVLDIELSQGESVYTQSGGMSWMSKDIHMDTNMRGGLMKGLGRMFSGESLFMVTYTAQAPNSNISFAPGLPGVVFAHDVTNSPLILQKSSFLCAQTSVNLEVTFAKKFAAGMFGGEGFILQKVDGHGMVFMEISGNMVKKELQAGEVLLVDTGNLVAFEPNVGYDIQTVKGVKNVLFGGEGLFLTKMTGPGTVYLQTNTLQSLMMRMSAPGNQ